MIITTQDGVQVPSIKDQTIAHWEDNLKRVKAMSWRSWKHAHDITRREVLFGITGKKYPHISGNSCPYCTRYHRSCRTGDGYVQCPLKQEDVPGGCCVAWLNVRTALLSPWTKEQTITAIEKMIEYIKEKG